MKYGERLHPEGAPGFVTQTMREAMGDALYEERLATERRVHALHERRYSMVTACWSMFVLILLVVFVLGVVTWVQWLAR